jgi:N-acyl-D-amino-acid deacylase
MMSRAVKAVALAAALATASFAAPPVAAPFDIVIRNGRVLDGAGNPWIAGDVAIKGGRIARIGVVEGRGKIEVDARNKYVAPGWIDMMDQSGEVLLKNGLAENKVRMGVTTAMAGEAGTPVDASGIDGYLTKLQRQGISINFGTSYGFSQARIIGMGDGAGTPTESQLVKMRADIATAMEGGAFGMTTALVYAPDSFASTAELIDLAKVVAKYHGTYSSHVRDEGAGLVAAVKEAIEIGERSGANVEIYHLKAAYAPAWGTLMVEAGSVIQAARDRGVNVAANLYPYPAGGTGLEITAPSWVFAEGFEKGLEKLEDPADRARLKRELAAGSQLGWSNPVEATGGWDRIMLANAHNPKYDRYRSQSIAYIAKELGKDPADLAWDMVIEARPDRATALFFSMDEKDIRTALAFPWTSIGSDAGAVETPGVIDPQDLPHPRSYGTFPRILAKYVKETGVLTLPEAVRKMTSWPAARMGLQDRGLLREGLKADIVVFDFDRIADGATWENPVALPTGVDQVIVNGVLVLTDGKHTGAKPGEVLRGPGYKGAAASNAQ